MTLVTQKVIVTVPVAVLVVVNVATPFALVLADTTWLIEPEKLPVTLALATKFPQLSLIVTNACPFFLLPQSPDCR